jgi:hypothetical protein
MLKPRQPKLLGKFVEMLPGHWEVLLCTEVLLTIEQHHGNCPAKTIAHNEVEVNLRLLATFEHLPFMLRELRVELGAISRRASFGLVVTVPNDGCSY